MFTFIITLTSCFKKMVNPKGKDIPKMQRSGLQGWGHSQNAEVCTGVLSLSFGVCPTLRLYTS
jgi:hypothetical protein